MTEKSRQEFKQLKKEKSFYDKIERVFHHFKRLSLKRIRQIYLESDSRTLIKYFSWEL